METYYVWIDDLVDPAGGGLWAAEVETEAEAAAVLAKLPAGIGGEYYASGELEAPPRVASPEEVAKFLEDRAELDV